MAGHLRLAVRRVECPERATRVEGQVMDKCADCAGGWFVYILRCADDSFYVGHTHNVDTRVAAHNEGNAARWTASRRPVELVYQEAVASRAAAVSREGQLKKWSRSKKAALTGGQSRLLRKLRVSRSNNRLQNRKG